MTPSSGMTGHPLAPSKGLRRECVAYAGCASKTLTPALRLGWIALPGRLVDDVLRQKLLDDMGTTVLEQLTLAPIRRYRRTDPASPSRASDLSSPARCRPRSGRRIAARCGAQARRSGLHMYVQLPEWCDELRLIDAAYTRGLVIEGASWHWSVPGSAPPALVLGYGTIDEPVNPYRIQDTRVGL